MDAVERNGYELIVYPAYLPDLAPSDFFLFSNLKRDVHGYDFQSDGEVVTAAEERVNGKDPDFYAPAYSKNSGRALSVTPVRPVRLSVRPSVRPTFVSGP